MSTGFIGCWRHARELLELAREVCHARKPCAPGYLLYAQIAIGYQFLNILHALQQVVLFDGAPLGGSKGAAQGGVVGMYGCGQPFGQWLACALVVADVGHYRLFDALYQQVGLVFDQVKAYGYQCLAYLL